MSISTAPVAVRSGRRETVPGRLRTYFADSPTRTLQTVLGLIWTLDGALQFQSVMYSHGFIASLKVSAAGQPGWVHDSIIWAADIAARDLSLWNSLFAITQVLIGLGLLVRPGGLVGVRGARIMWSALWLVMAWLWLGAGSASPTAIRDMIDAAPSGMSWLSSLQDGFAAVARGNGVSISLVLAATSAAIGIGVGVNRCAKQFLWLAVLLNVVYWLVGQGLGGIFAGGATDPNAAPLFLLLAYGLYRLIPYGEVRSEPGGVR